MLLKSIYVVHLKFCCVKLCVIRRLYMVCNHYLAWSFLVLGGVTAAPVVSRAAVCRAAFSDAYFFSIFQLFLVPRLGGCCASLQGTPLPTCSANLCIFSIHHLPRTRARTGLSGRHLEDEPHLTLHPPVAFTLPLTHSCI